MSIASREVVDEDVAVAVPIRRAPVRAVLLPGVVVLVLVGLSALLYQASIHAVSGNSDGATVILEGASLRHGHLALGGWSLSRDSFWTIDALFSMVAVFVEGIRPSLLYLVPAVIAALVVGVGAVLARAQATRTGRAVAVLAVVALLALPSRALSLFYLQGPYHVGTAAWALLAFIGLRSRRFGWGWAAAVVLLGLGILGDLQIAVFGVLPALGAGILAMARRRDWRAGIATASAAPASVALAFAVREVADLFGTFSVNPANPTASPSQMVANLTDIIRYAPALLGFGAGPFGATGMPSFLSDLHVVGVAVVLAGVLAATTSVAYGSLKGRSSSIGAGQGDWHLEDLLLLAFYGDIGVFVRLDEPGMNVFSRYLTAGIIFGAILGARALGRLCDRGNSARIRRGSLVATLGIALAFLAGFASSLRDTPPPATTGALVAFLEVHGLTRGLGDYWSASIVTVQSSAKVVVRPVIDGPNGTVVRYNRQSSARWYEGEHFQFVVYDAALPLVSTPVAVATFGKPVHSYAIGLFRVVVFGHPIAVSTVGAGA